MTERRKYCDTSGTTAGKGQHEGGLKPKTNRLRRSLKQTQVSSSPKRSQEDFKTPTRLTTRSTYNNVFNKVNSPLNESELHHDIIWDANSPSPLRTGNKRGNKCSANVGIVDINEIVNRIAPKYGRPVVPDSSLDQWIGDSAIPCTPDVQQPKARRRSPRPNGVADLLKLAKQFDFNFFRQDEDSIKDKHEQSMGLLSDSKDILDLDGNENQHLSLPCNVKPAITEPALKTNCTIVSKDSIPPPAYEMEDDLDFLFDGPTQDISGNLSQTSLPRSMEVETDPTVSSKPTSEKGPDFLNGHLTTVSVPHVVKRTQANNSFDDDWGNDDLLDDSLVFEMTQNPDIFAAPKHCSTQSGSSETKYVKNISSDISNNALPIQHQQVSRAIQPGVSEEQNEHIKHRKTFTLEGNPHFQLKNILSVPSKEVSDTVKPASHQKSLPSNKAASVGSGYQWCQKTQRLSNGMKTIPQVPLFHQSTSASTSSSILTATNSYSNMPLQAENSSYRKPAMNHHSEATRIVTNPPSPCIIPEDDLDSLFASDFSWDDKGDDDDDLLCQASDSMESQVERIEGPVITPFLALPSNQTHIQKLSAVPAPQNSSRYNGNGKCYSVNQKTEATQPQNTNMSTYSQSASKNCSVFPHSLYNNGVPVAVVSGSTRMNDNVLPEHTTKNTIYRPRNTVAGQGLDKMTEIRGDYVAGRTNKQHVTGSGVSASSFLAPVTVCATPSQFTFKRLSACISKPVNTVNSKEFVSTQAVGKCSAEEIELKKQQAMEKRRQRMLNGNNLKALS
ncbi:hypothetical protein UPYG_G00068150 [Umbra pygmaea]|uniref:ETAA1 activator of ATR kinase n=1 Tax=Umbra pygmaea TaxID=75934 RepID=A0ABD0XYC7_UMBPY